MNKSSIIIFNGPPSTGKDVMCSFLRQSPYCYHFSFKTRPIDIACATFGVPKNTFLEWHSHDVLDCNTESKELPRPELGGRSTRQALKFVSETMVKPVLGCDFFGIAVGMDVSKTLQHVNDFGCTSDGGFIEEIEGLQSIVGEEVDIRVVRLHREGCNFDDDTRYYLTQEMLDNIGVESVDIYNTQDTVQAFLNSTMKQLEEMGWL